MRQTVTLTLMTVASAASIGDYDLDSYYRDFGGFSYDDFKPSYRHSHPVHVIETPVYEPFEDDVSYPKPY